MLKRLLFLAALLLAACAPPTVSTPTPLAPTPEPTSPPVPMKVFVNGEGLPLSEYEAALQRYINAKSVMGSTVTQQEAAEIVLQDLIDQMLLAQGAHAAGFVLDDAALQARLDELAAEVGGQTALLQWMAARGYTEDLFRAALRRGAEAAWMRDHIAGRVPDTAEQVHLRQILLYNAETANNVLARLRAGESFDTLAVLYDPQTGGELGWVPRGYLLDKRLEEAAFALQPGQYSDVIATDIGYHILMVLERDPAHPLSPDARLVLQELAVRDWLARQRAIAEIVPGS